MGTFDFPLLRHLEEGTPVVLARLISRGSPGPRRTGATLLLTSGGKVQGTVGGGLLEQAVLAQAGRILREGRTFILHPETEPADEAGCGGTAEVFLEPFFPGDEELMRLLRAREEIVSRGESGLLATRIVEGIARPPRALITPGDIFEAGGALPPGVRRALAARLPLSAPRLETLAGEAEGAWLLYLEPVTPAPVLLLLGAGHIAAALAPIAHRLGFRVWVADTRPGLADPGRFPDAERVRAGRAAELLAELSPEERPYVVIAGPTHEADRECLRAALERETAYLGMLGSRRKRESVFRALRREGLAEEKLSRVHCPAGLAIGAETPEEIAVSIAAELVRERAAFRAAPQTEEPPA